MTKKSIKISPSILKKSEELVGAKETVEDLWNIFNNLMDGYDENYFDYSSNQVGYLFMLFIFGYCYGVDDMPRIMFDDGENDKGLH